MHVDVFNGDADGLCALLQLRLAEPKESTLITGVKRDINLLKRVDAKSGDIVTVLDVSMQKNAADLSRLLSQGAEVFYCDHHQAGEIPASDQLTALINLDANVCTSLLINGYLKGAFAEWAIAGAFGDNLKDSARAVAKPLGLSDGELTILERVGILLNYNGYGASLDDLYFAPDELFKKLLPFSSPLVFFKEGKTTFDVLDQGYDEDFAKAEQAKKLFDQPHAAVLVLPDAPWARRVSGVFGNELANQHLDRAHAIFTEKEGGYLVSVRAPLVNKQGADVICSQFETGGGRAAAAGVNFLPASDAEKFVSVFSDYYK